MPEASGAGADRASPKGAVIKFSVIYADPPWPYKDKRTHASTGAVLSAYPTMTIEALAALPIAPLAQRSSLLFLWATLPKLPEALTVMAAWGFRYVTTPFVWVKARPLWRPGDPLREADVYAGLGHYTQGNAELVLLGRRGKPWRERKDIKQIVIAPRGRHSAKPAIVREKIVSLLGDVPRLELFAREATPGWIALGRELDALPIEASLALLAKEF